MLNPDGGVNLNRVYENQSKEHHPTIFAAKQLIDYYHSLNKKDAQTKNSLFLNIDIHGLAMSQRKGYFFNGNQAAKTTSKFRNFCSRNIGNIESHNILFRLVQIQY